MVIGACVMGSTAMAFGGWAAWVRYDLSRRDVAVSRNFYGTLRVMEGRTEGFGEYRQLVHGTIIHGFQLMEPEKKRMAVGYYRNESGVARAIRALPEGPRRIGIIGLGTGAMAAHVRDGDVMRFYDIDPGVVVTARKYFTYLADAPGKVDVVMGDARLSMEREQPQNYDVLAVDAFSGDAVPLHLLTVEAIDLYLKHLKQDGILALHVSNKFLDLPPVVERAAQLRGLSIVMTRDLDDHGTIASDWVLLARSPTLLDSPVVRAIAVPIATRREWRPWTDDHVDLLRVLK
ncbi:MAG TPA: fused MFS/spermidine synthase, partial [Vineibacter sp.]|nr:fused MFS/spermidine synthase [Vineibacter sp.]